MAAGDEYYENLLKAEILYSGERNTAANIFYLSCLSAAGATLAVLNTLAEDIGGDWGTYVMPFVSSAVTAVECLLSDWTSSTGLTGSYAMDVAGGLTGDNLTDQVATLINGETSRRYRGGRQRIYVPQPDVTAIENGDKWTSDFSDAMTGGIQTWMEHVNELEIGDDLLTLSLYHRGSTNVPQGFEATLQLTCNITPGTQRRRVRRVGHLR